MSTATAVSAATRRPTASRQRRPYVRRKKTDENSVSKPILGLLGLLVVALITTLGVIAYNLAGAN